ncbi:30S ribosomal protein S4 chloroplastic [Bienertia sinuspersici]
MALTIPGARQLVNHRHILLLLQTQDIIISRDEQKSKALIQNSLDSSLHEEFPKHLTLHPFPYKGLVNQITDSKWVGLKINELLVVEYYSRQT